MDGSRHIPEIDFKPDSDWQRKAHEKDKKRKNVHTDLLAAAEAMLGYCEYFLLRLKKKYDWPSSYFIETEGNIAKFQAAIDAAKKESSYNTNDFLGL